MALGTAFLGGLMLGELTNGDQHAAPRDSITATAPRAARTSRGENSSQGGMTDAVRHAARASGADDAISSAAAALLSTAGQRIKDIIDETYLGSWEWTNARRRPAEGSRIGSEPPRTRRLPHRLPARPWHNQPGRRTGGMGQRLGCGRAAADLKEAP